MILVLLVKSKGIAVHAVPPGISFVPIIQPQIFVKIAPYPNLAPNVPF